MTLNGISSPDLSLEVQWLLIHKQNAWAQRRSCTFLVWWVFFLDPFGVIWTADAGDGGQGVSAKCQQCTVSCGARNLEETPQWQGGCDFPPRCFYACYYWLPGFKRAEVQELRQRRWEEWGRDHSAELRFACPVSFFLFQSQVRISSIFFGINTRIWVFPKMVVPPKSSILIGISIMNHSFWVPQFLETPIWGKRHSDFVDFLGYLRCVAGIDGWGYGSSKEAAGAYRLDSVLNPNFLTHLLPHKMCVSFDLDHYINLGWFYEKLQAKFQEEEKDLLNNLGSVGMLEIRKKPNAAPCWWPWASGFCHFSWPTGRSADRLFFPCVFFLF